MRRPRLRYSPSAAFTITNASPHGSWLVIQWDICRACLAGQAFLWMQQPDGNQLPRHSAAMGHRVCTG